MMHRPYGPVYIPSRAELVTQRNEAVAALRALTKVCPDCTERTMALLLLSVLDEMERVRRLELAIAAARSVA